MNENNQITSHKVERHIDAQAHFISNIIEASPDIISIVNAESGTTVYVNRMLLRELGYSTEDIRLNQLERNFNALYHQEDLEMVEKFKGDIYKANAQDILQFEARLKAKNGSWQWYRTRAKVFERDANEIVKKYICFSQNITAQKSSEEERKKNTMLVELSKAKTQFFTNVSHEFRTPLALIQGQTDELLVNPDENLSVVQLQKLQMVQRNAFRLQKLVNSQLDFSEIEEGRMNSIFQPTDISSFTQGLASNFHSLIESSGLKFVVNCGNVKDQVYVSHELWEKIIFNLISNAFKFTFDGKIQLKLKENKRHIQLSIQDTGTGIAKENISKIFDRFKRIPAAKSRTPEGSGIGLSLVKEFVLLHGGSIKVNSQEGKGTKFTISIPKGKSHLPPKQIFETVNNNGASSVNTFLEQASGWVDISVSKQRSTRNTKASRRKKNILIVDDHSDMRHFFEQILSDHFVVITANSSEQALDVLINKANVDLIIADILMPASDGIELLSKIKRNADIAHIPVVMVSALADEESKLLALKHDADDYIVKPFSKKVLLQRIHAHIEKTSGIYSGKTIPV